MKVFRYQQSILQENTFAMKNGILDSREATATAGRLELLHGVK